MNQPPVSLRVDHRSWATLAFSLVACLLLAGCGAASTDSSAAQGSPSADPDGSPSSPSGEAFPVNVSSGHLGADREITVEARPTSIVSLSPTATEMLWSIGADDQVVAVDDQSDYPRGVPTTKLSGYQPNVEAILAYAPDLVVMSGEGGDLVAGLDTAGVPTLLLPSATGLGEAYSQMERLGVATGHAAEAARVVAEIQTGIEEAVAAAPDGPGLTYFHELDPTLYTATGDTFIGEIYGLFGLKSVADAAGVADDYPQLSAEYVVSADPDFVFLADTDCCDVTVDTVRNRPGWARVAAVRHDQIYVVDKDITSRWGPRVVKFAELVGQIVAKHQRMATRSATTG